jgi:DNA repair protein RadC
LQVSVLDHIIIGNDTYFSFLDKNIIWNRGV